MTTEEFRNEFELEYTSIASNGAPPLDAYEISVLLTQAQEELVKSRYDPNFEIKERVRRDISELINNGISVVPKSYPSDFLNQRSRFFEINDNVMYIIQEKVKLNSSDECLTNIFTDIKPIKHDKYNYNIKNPFKKPDKNTSWRIDYKKKEGKKVVEILTVENTVPTEYHYRYIKYPNPIIIEDLDSGLSINGISVATNSELNESFHREILDRAVELALETTGNPRLQSKIQIDQR